MKVSFFFSKTVKKIFAEPCYKMQVNGYRHFESQKSIYRQHKMNPRGSWLLTEVLWSETELCKKLNIIYNIITCNPEPQANGPEWCMSEAQIYRLLNNCLSDADSLSDSKWAKIPVYLILWWMNHSALQFLRQSLKLTRTEDRWATDTHAWTKHKFLWLLMVYVIRLVDED